MMTFIHNLIKEYFYLLFITSIYKLGTKKVNYIFSNELSKFRFFEKLDIYFS